VAKAHDLLADMFLAGRGDDPDAAANVADHLFAASRLDEVLQLVVDEDWPAAIPDGFRRAQVQGWRLDVAVLAQHRAWGHQQLQPVPPRFGYHAEQGREQGPIRPVELHPARLLPLQYGELMAQDQDFCGLPRLLAPRQPQPRGNPCDQEEHEPQAHER
jgi:hypothetical protein